MTFCTGSMSIGPLRMLSSSVEIVLYMSQQSAAMAIPRETGVSGVSAGCTLSYRHPPKGRGVGFACTRNPAQPPILTERYDDHDAEVLDRSDAFLPP